jgi:penicillin-binding protein 1A
MNEPVTIETDNGTPWTPKEANRDPYDSKLHPLSWGLANSRNNYSAWIMKQARQPKAVANFIHDMGVSSYIKPVYALCTGAWESNVYEMVGAYCTFANEGVYNTPIFVTRIEDRQGNVISSFATSSQDAISKESAYTMITMMKSVITQGTGSRLVRAYGMGGVDIAGKTGTTNKNRDAWFICVTPNLAVGSWVGAEDQTVSLYHGGEGSVMALPIVGDFLRSVHKDPNINVNRTDKFTRPVRWRAANCSDTLDEKPSAEEEFFE